MPYDGNEPSTQQHPPQDPLLPCAHAQPVATADNWGLTLPGGAWGFDENAPIEGRNLICSGRRSLGRIKNVFPDIAVIETVEGELYALGDPNPLFRATHPGLMARLGK